MRGSQGALKISPPPPPEEPSFVVHRRFRAAPPIHIEDLDLYHIDHAEIEQQKSYRLVVITILSGLIMALIVAGLVAFFLYAPPPTPPPHGSSPAQGADLPSVSLPKAGYTDRSVVFKKSSPIPSLAPQPPVAQIVLPRRPFHASVSRAYPSVLAETLPYGSATLPVPGTNTTTITKSLPEPSDERIVVDGKTSLAHSIAALGVDDEKAEEMVRSLETVYPVSTLKIGQEITVTLERQLDFYGQDAITPVRLSFSPSKGGSVVVESDEDGQFFANLSGISAPSAPYLKTNAKVGASLYASAKDNGVPGYIIAQMMQIYAYDVDFQRQLKSSDTFEIFYGPPLTNTSKNRKVILYSSLTVGGKEKLYYRFTTSSGETGYYDENGRSAQRSLMRTPVPGSRISSGFGMRRHPILGYNRMHQGVDFAAPYGTPIRAAGNGVITAAGWQGAYGKVVHIQHGGSYETVYAHMSRIAPEIEVGARVRQSQVIGFVGATGRATGPHAHFEIRKNGRPVNPLSVKGVGGNQLSDRDLALFQKQKAKIIAMRNTAPQSQRLAQLQGTQDN